MALDDLSGKEQAKINESIALHKKSILEDINLTLRIITKDKTYITKLVEWPSEKFIFAAPLEKLDWILFETGKIVKMSFITKRAIFSANVKILNRYRKNEMLFYTGTLIGPLLKEQQRKYFRLDVLLELTYKILPKEPETYILEELPAKQATSVNISIGGMSLVCNEQYNKNDKLLLKFEFMNNSLEISGEVLAKGEKNAAGNYAHRVKFLNLDPSMENTLSRLIYEKQRELMSKLKIPLT